MTAIERRGRKIKRAFKWRALSSWMDRQGWTAPTLARAMGVTRQSMYRWLQLCQLPSMDHVNQICLKLASPGPRPSEIGASHFDPELIRAEILKDVPFDVTK